MTTAQPPASAADHLQPVHFRLTSHDGTKAVFEAQIEDLKAVGKPVYQLTVTVSSSILREATGELAIFLSEMSAGFAVLPKPEPFDDEDSHAGDFDIATQIKIEPDLIRFAGPRPVDVEVVVETATGLNAPPSGLPSYPDAVVKKQNHFWDSRSGSKARAIVTPSYGHGRVDPGNHDVTGTTGADVQAKRVKVHGYIYTPYTFTGRFRKE
jgi:hypothetical protein